MVSRNQQVMGRRGCDLQRALGAFLALMSARSGRTTPPVAMRGSGRPRICTPLKWFASWISESGASTSMSPRPAGGLRATGGRADEAMAATVGGDGGGQYPCHRGERAVEGELAQRGEALERVSGIAPMAAMMPSAIGRS